MSCIFDVDCFSFCCNKMTNVSDITYVVCAGGRSEIYLFSEYSTMEYGKSLFKSLNYLFFVIRNFEHFATTNSLPFFTQVKYVGWLSYTIY